MLGSVTSSLFRNSLFYEWPRRLGDIFWRSGDKSYYPLNWLDGLRSGSAWLRAAVAMSQLSTDLWCSLSNWLRVLLVCPMHAWGKVLQRIWLITPQADLSSFESLTFWCIRSSHNMLLGRNPTLSLIRWYLSDLAVPHWLGSTCCDICEVISDSNRSTTNTAIITYLPM